MNRKLVADMAERAGFTFLQAFLSVWMISSWADLTDVGLWQRAAVAGIAAALSVVKGFAASKMGDGSAAFLPAAPRDSAG